MPTPNCKECVHFDDACGLPGRCRLVMDSIKRRMLDANGKVTADELRYFIRTEELPDEYWQWICEKFEQKSISAKPVALTPEELKDLWQYIYSLRGYTVNIESAKRGEMIFNAIEEKLREQTEIGRIKAIEKVLKQQAMFGKENSECSTQEKEEQ